MKKKPYSLQLQTPSGLCIAEADTMPGLVEITPRGLFGGFQERQEKKPEDNLDTVVRELWTEFLKRKKDMKTVRPSSISQADCELDLIRCYLQGITVGETTVFLSELSGKKISHSAVGRYWKELNKIGPDFKARL